MADDFSKQVKDQADIVKIVGEYLKLRKAGAQNWQGLCPFHKEKSPSFSVNAVHGYFYCFGCHEKGDVFTFVMKMDGLSFPEAVRAVAAKVGLAVPRRAPGSPEEAREAGLRKQLLDVHEAATQYFEAHLKAPTAAQAREYLAGRGTTPETIAKFRLGFAPDDFNDMRERLQPHFPEDALRASGLFSSSEKDDGGAPTGPLYSRFRKRITFPIANEQGRVIAFTARALSEADSKGRPQAKYLNSPETPLFHKGNVLFNLHNAKADMRTNDFAVLVEGQMDCIAVYMSGIRNVLATSGTAFTEAQVRLLSRFTRRVIVNFDPDLAGATAAEKSIALLVEEGFDIKIVTLDDGLDPDRFLRERGVKSYMEALRGARRHADYLIDRARILHPGRTADSKLKAMNFLLPHIRRMPSALHRDEFAADAAQKLSIDSALLRQELKAAAAQRVESVAQFRPEPVSELERVLLRLLVTPGPARERAAEALLAHPEYFEELGAGALLESLAQAPAPANPLEAAPDDRSRAILAEVLASTPEAATDAHSPVQDPVELADNAIHTLTVRHLDRRLRELRASLAEAERREDTAMLDTLRREVIRVQKALREG